MMDPTPDSSPQLDRHHHFHRRGVAGIALIVIGAFALLATVFQSDVFGLLFLPALGLIFLAWGIASRHARPLVPGGLLLGIGVGVLLSQLIYGSDGRPSIILLCMGLGFIIITPLSIMFTTRAERWPLIPGVILAILGIVFFIGGTALETAQILGKFWPVFLIVIGLYLLWEWNRQAKKS